VDSLFNLPKEDEEIYKPRTHEIDLSSRLAQMNDTNKLGNKYKNGNRSRDSIVLFVQNRLQDLRDEYNYYLKDAFFKGVVTVEFNVLSDGSVTSCKQVKSTIKNNAFTNSILSKVKGWKFPKITVKNDTTNVVYPFVFSP
jgi:TonB family protein